VLLPEYLAKTLFAEYGIAIPPGRTVDDADEAAAVARELGLPVMLKVQARAGGRGLAGGVLCCDQAESAPALYRRLADQWPEAGAPRGVLVEVAVPAAAERYLAVAVDPRLGQPVLLAAATGGVAVEQQVHEGAAALHAHPIDPCLGLQPHHAVTLLKAAGWPRERLAPTAALATRLYRLFREQEAIVAEINPLAETTDDRLVALDARVALDDLALFRQPRWRDLVLASPPEVRATEGGPPPSPVLASPPALGGIEGGPFAQEAIKLRFGFDYVDLDPDGTVGLVSTGAGGTMLLVDLIRARGAQPANFVDLRTGGMHGDSTRLEVVLTRLRERPRLRAVLVSVFGGITDIAEFAETLLQATERVGGVPWPLVVRLEGYGADEGLALLAERGIATERDLDAAVARVVELASA
jgi:succinyl-CoA synthetase beta subunit